MPGRTTQDGQVIVKSSDVVHWKRKSQPTPTFLSGETHGQYEKAQRYDTGRWAPEVGRCPSTEEEQRAITNSSRKKEAAEPTARNNAGKNAQLWVYLMVKVKSNDYKEQYFIGTWNVRAMNQGKLDMIKQEMARLNKDILWINELKWMGMGEFNSDDHCIYVGKNPLEKKG